MEKVTVCSLRVSFYPYSWCVWNWTLPQSPCCFFIPSLLRPYYINNVRARGCLTSINILSFFCPFVIKKLRKRLVVWKNRRTFAPANEKGTPDFVGAVAYARSSRGALHCRKEFFEILTTRQVVQGSTVSTRRNRHFWHAWSTFFRLNVRLHPIQTASRWLPAVPLRAWRMFPGHDILQWRVWSWLRMNASYRLNTCKSRGSMIKACFDWWRPAHGCVTRIQPAVYLGIALWKED